MTTFEVDPNTLAELAGTLNDLGPVLQQLKQLAQSDTGQLGGSDIEGAAEHVGSHWSYGAGQLEKHVGNMGRNLQQAAENYASTEGNIIKAADGVRL